MLENCVGHICQDELQLACFFNVTTIYGCVDLMEQLWSEIVKRPDCRFQFIRVLSKVRLKLHKNGAVTIDSRKNNVPILHRRIHGGSGTVSRWTLSTADNFRPLPSLWNWTWFQPMLEFAPIQSSRNPPLELKIERLVNEKSEPKWTIFLRETWVKCGMW